MKINTPLQVTIICALISSLSLVLSIFLIFENFLEIQIKTEVYFILTICLFIISGFIIYFLLELFINRKIRLLFRMIQNYKMSKSDIKINMNEDILSASEIEVTKWVKKNSSEISKLKKEEKFRREFIGNLAHELKTPIFSVQGYILTLLEGGLQDKSVNERFLNRALKGVERMDKIISDLDMITKFESEKFNMNFNRHDIIEICKEILESLELKAKEKKVKLNFAEDYDRSIFVSCDKSKMGQVFQNLIMNAINYSGEKSDIIVRFSNVDANVLVEVEDNGLGIEETHLRRLFERFYRIDKSRARNIGGTGLGLAIVKHIIEAHGHSIQVRSTIGKGSTFFFTLTKV